MVPVQTSSFEQLYNVLNFHKVPYKVTIFSAKIHLGAQIFKSFILEEINLINIHNNAQKSKCIGTVFQINVSVALVLPLGRRHKKTI